jgi:hypothetical protein
MRPLSVALAAALVFTIGAASHRSLAGDDVLEEASDLLKEDRPREALAKLAAAKGLEQDSTLLALRGQALIELRRFAEAKAALEKVDPAASVASDALVLRARIEFFYGRDERATALLAQAASTTQRAKALSALIEGPFAARWGEAASACRVRSKEGHYLVATDMGMKAGQAAGEPLPAATLMAETMELAYKAYGKVFELPRDDGLLRRVYVFEHREDFLAYAERLKGPNSLPPGSLGGFDSKTRALVVDGTPDRRDRNELPIPDMTLRAILHEGCHQFHDEVIPGMPSWFDEGLAEYFTASRLVKNELRVGGVDPARFKNLLELLDGTAGSELLPLWRFLDLDRKGFFEPSRIQANYAEAWGVVHFLLSSEKGKKLLRAFAGALRDGRGAKAAVSEAFGREDLAAMDKEWRAHVRGLAVPQDAPTARPPR